MIMAPGAVPPGASKVVRGASVVVRLGSASRGAGWLAQPALVNGAAGVVVTRGGRPFSVLGFTVRGGKIVAIDIRADPARLRRPDLAALGDCPAGPPYGSGSADAWQMEIRARGRATGCTASGRRRSQSWPAVPGPRA